WVVAPPRTHTGAVILLADPHTELQNAAYYEYRMDAGNLKSSGFALGPLLWQANNEQVSWAMTTGNPDLWDCYAVEVDPDQPSRYRYDGEWQEMIRAEESFGVKAADPVTRVFEYTRHNGVLSPVVSRTGKTAYVVSVSQMHDTGLLDNEIWRMNHAASVLELRDAMSMLGMFPQNIVAGDTSGNIWYLRAGKTPIRPTGYNWRQVVPGNSSDTAWQGFYEIEDMIQVLNPPQNYLQNNNVAPDRLFGDVNLDAADYPEALFYDTPGRMTSRGLRTLEILDAAADFTIGQAMELAFDETWVTTEYWQMALRFALQTYPEWLENQSKEVAALVERILNFDGVASAESEAALNFYYWRNGMKAVLDRPQFNHLRSLPWSLEDFDPEFAAAILDQAETAAAQMVDELGGTQRSLGSVFRVGRDEASWPVGGETIDVPEEVDCLADFSPLCERTMRAFASGPPDANGERRAYRGSHAMRLVELSRPVRAWTLHLHGQSSHPDSPHYDDQDRLASERKFKPAYFSWNELQGHIESTTMLEWDPAAQ
ncbi:MAG TPA: penicillin acylase family protein, partial [Xanthomonadales bacterium]|nr:penicillin acylase family protein [Xanthomonadales bacterium]